MSVSQRSAQLVSDGISGAYNSIESGVTKYYAENPYGDDSVVNDIMDDLINTQYGYEFNQLVARYSIYVAEREDLESQISEYLSEFGYKFAEHYMAMVSSSFFADEYHAAKNMVNASGGEDILDQIAGMGLDFGFAEKQNDEDFISEDDSSRTHKILFAIQTAKDAVVSNSLNVDMSRLKELFKSIQESGIDYETVTSSMIAFSFMAWMEFGRIDNILDLMLENVDNDNVSSFTGIKHMPKFLKVQYVIGTFIESANTALQQIAQMKRDVDFGSFAILAIYAGAIVAKYWDTLALDLSLPLAQEYADKIDSLITD